MMKGLESLKHLFDVICGECKHKFYKNGNECSKPCNIPETAKTIEKELKALEVISQNFKLVGNCLHAKNKYAESGWVFVKELEDEEEHNAWKEVLK